MPHGSRIARDGRHQYSACMMNDLLVEVDTENMKVSRSFRVSAGKEQGFTGMPQEKTEHREGMTMPMNMAGITCSPTWAQPSSDGSRVYVACNKIQRNCGSGYQGMENWFAGFPLETASTISVSLPMGNSCSRQTSETRLFPFMMPQVQRNSPVCRPTQSGSRRGGFAGQSVRLLHRGRHRRTARHCRNRRPGSQKDRGGG